MINVMARPDTAWKSVDFSQTGAVPLYEPRVQLGLSPNRKVKGGGSLIVAVTEHATGAPIKQFTRVEIKATIRPQ